MLGHVGSEELLNAPLRGVCAGASCWGAAMSTRRSADAREILAYADSTDHHECFSHGLALQALALRAG